MKRFFDDKILQRWISLWKEPIEAHNQVQDGLIIRYEEMKDNHAELLDRVFEYLACGSSKEIIDACIERATFEKMSGRKVGDEGQPLSKTRKGISGDWKNYFTKRDGILFDELAGHLLVELGYEQDKKWIDSLPDELDFFCE